MKKKRIIFITCTLLFLFCTSVYVFASNGTKNISATYRNIVIKVNNVVQQTAQEPFIYNDYTYVPLRFVSESLGANVQWDDKTSTISITSANPADSNAVKAIDKIKAFTGEQNDTLRVAEVISINGDLFYRVERTSSRTGKTEDIYYNTSDTRLYTYTDRKLTNYQ